MVGSSIPSPVAGRVLWTTSSAPLLLSDGWSKVKIMQLGIRKVSTVGALVVSGLLHVGGMGAALADSTSTDTPAWTELRTQASSEGTQALAASDQRSDLFRQAPTVSGQVRVNEQTLIPYIGAGFGGGFVTERDRALPACSTCRPRTSPSSCNG